MSIVIYVLHKEQNKGEQKQNKTREEKNKITFNLTYYRVFQNDKKTFAEVLYFLTPDVSHKAVFTNVPITGFENDRSLKDHLARTVLPKVDA